jgi:predicted TIM-barrel fold metal-dependent hydrolase
MKNRYPWVKHLLKKSDPEPPIDLPIRLDSWSNGEAFFEQTPRQRILKKRILDKCDENARRVGCERREFLVSSMGMATTLLMMNCSSEEGTDDGGGDGNTCAGIPAEAQFDEELACEVLGGDEFIFDIQTHHYVEGDWTRTNPAYKSFFDATGWYDLNRDEYIKRIFLESETTMAVLSGLPAPVCTDKIPAACGAPISNEQIAESRDTINNMAQSLRMLNHHMVVPNVRPENVQAQLDHMEAMHCLVGVAGWKLYPGFKSIDNIGYYLDDEIYGIPMIEKGRELGVKIFCIHKGLPIGTFFDTEHNQPRDIGVVAKRYPDCHFVIYHSSICAGIEPTGLGGGSCPEGPYDETEASPTGINQLIRTLQDNELGPVFDPSYDPAKGLNVYGELGTTWQRLFSSGATQAGHALGKMLKYMGTDNVCWGTDAMNASGPQSQIESMRTFQIPQELVDQHQYPQITAEVRAKIFGLNSARIFGVDVAKRRCAIEGEPTAMLKRQLDDHYGGRRHVLQQPLTPTTRRDFLRHAFKHKDWPA